MFKTSLRAQVLALLASGLLILLLIALGSFKFLAASLDDYTALVAGPLRATELVDRANVQFKTQVQEWKNVLLRGKDAKAADKYWAQFEEQERAVAATLQALGELPGVPAGISQNAQRLRAEHAVLGAAYRKGRDAFLASGADAASGDRAVAGVDRATSEQLNALVSELRTLADEQSLLINHQGHQAIIWGIAIMLVSGLLITALSLWLVNRNLVTPVRDLIDYVARLSQGHLAERVVSHRRDELGRLAVAANTLRDFLADTFTRLQRSTANLDQASGELNTIAAVMLQGTSEQFERTDQVATAMQEMSATAQEVARHAAGAATAADDADREAQDGEQAMQATIHTITRMRGEIAVTGDVIRQLRDDSGRIGKVLEVIRGIADQTNLLALNAAIEAARAGDAGRGFAVVADEVRTLAQRTAASTQEIHQIIDTVQTGAVNAVQAIESGQKRSDEGAEQVVAAGQTLTRITQTIESIRDMNRQIATAAEEQNAVVEDIAQNLVEITAIATTNQGSVERTQAASSHLHQLSAELAQVTARIKAA
ncbi:HAMP domain-containing protein [Pseudomonas sp. CFBP 13727]|uniref:methyl-accepting chemotaxis protein n=1 Tax=unclassified Pseudomonas TaxID=196821 RepID=UPI0017839379|nr:MULTISPECIES: methyl-accepting chemotaxis protein [unclassified Pseudomonas]MBD8622012.1 HAMP domain-containing protein [Pseudomonas sp. CFBP 13727]MBD8828031.1 HAMP domain-containing protein [Pseudomonas sp. CFBP 13602]